MLNVRPATHAGRGWRPWIVWTPAALFVVYNYAQQIVPGVIAPELAQAFQVSAGALGALAAYFFYAYAVLQIPVGLIVDRFGPWRPLLLAIGLATAGSLAFGSATAAGPAGLARLVIGAGAAFSFIACLKLVSNWFEPGRFATLAGLTNTAGMIGAATGAPLAVLAGRLGWRGAMHALGATGIALAALVLLLVRDRPAPPVAETSAGGRPRAADGILHGLRLIVQSSQAWLNALYAAAVSASFVAFGALWGTPFVARTYGVDAVAAASVVATLFLGAIAGSLFFGWFSDAIRSRRIPMAGGAVGALASLSAILYWPGLPLAGLRVCLALLGFFCSANIVSYAVAHDASAPGRAGIGLGFLNTCFYGGNALSQPLVGWLLDQRSARHGGIGIAGLEPADFRYAFSSVVVLLIVSLVAALWIREPFATQTPWKEERA